MNDRHENYPLIDSRQLDRLVDGELSDDDRRLLIEGLDRQPDKWRDCACAFLESQEFGTVLTDLAAGAALPRTMNAAIDAPRVRSRAMDAAGSRRSARRWWAVLAVGLLLGFVVGHFTDQDGSTSPDQPPLLVREESDIRNDGSLSDSTNALVGQTSPLNREQPFFGYANSSAVPTEIETILDHLGHRVERRHVYMPVLSEYGRQRVVPVEQVDFVPVGLETY